MTFRLGGKEHLAWVTHRFAMVGLAMLSVAMLLAIWMVIAHVFGDATATAVVAVLAVLVVIVWVSLPLRFRAQATSAQSSGGESGCLGGDSGPADGTSSAAHDFH